MMNKKFREGVFVLLAVAGFVLVYQAMQVSEGCVAVVVSATNRTTGVTKQFGSPCDVPFWYMESRDFNPPLLEQNSKQQPVSG